MINEWHVNGGVLVLGYDMFRILALTDEETVNQSLVDPGPDLVICDEGHLLKSDKSCLCDVLSEIHTKRRIALTGTPLQNNLLEYFFMVNFVKPFLLGTTKEFCNRFANPIENGQYIDSTQDDIDLMIRRSYVLNKLLDGCIQPLGLSVLERFLKPKEEYVIYVRLSKLQIMLYKVLKKLNEKSI